MNPITTPIPDEPNSVEPTLAETSAEQPSAEPSVLLTPTESSPTEMSSTEPPAEPPAEGDSPATEATADPSDSLPEEIARRAEAEGLYRLYPDFSPSEALADPELGAILRGERQPDLRRLYEAVHMDRIVQERVAQGVAAALDAAVSAAVSEAVARAVSESEERLLAHIRARGQRPAENGTAGAAGIRLHPAVDRLTRRERAMLALRAEQGETVRL